MDNKQISFTIISEKDGQIQRIQCPERIDLNISSHLREILTQLTDQAKYKIIMDLSATKYIDSSGLGAIVSRIAVSRSNQGDVVLAGVNENIMNLLELTHLNKILKVYKSIDEALASYEKSR
jgi:anti-sigma B factor antagonist